MNTRLWLHLPALALVTASLSQPALAQQRSFSVGYVYPAGAKQGATSEHVIAGQFIRDALDIDITGGGVKAEIVEIIRPINGSELNELRIKIDEFMARRAVVRKDDRALENFRSFKDAKDIKSGPASNEEVDALKLKYAGAAWTPEDEKQLAEMRRRLASGVRKPANPAISELVVCRFTVEPDALPTRRELRLRSLNGLSNPVAFFVGQWDEFSEPASKNIAEQKSEIAKTSYGPKGGGIKKTAATISLPAVINGQVLPGEVDQWRFQAKKGANLVFSVQARQLIPYISDAVPGWFQATLSLSDASGTELAYRDDFRFDPDPVLHYEIPADGEYVIQIKDSIYRGREDFVYRVTVGETPFITNGFPLGGRAGTEIPVEVRGWNLKENQLTYSGKDKPVGINPLFLVRQGQVSNSVSFDLDTLPECLAAPQAGTPSAPQSLSLPVIVNGRISKKDETALFSFPGKAGTTVVAEVMARRLNSPLDSIITLIAPDGKELAFNDDNLDRADGLTTHHADSYLMAALPADGVYQLRLSDAQHRGGMDYVYRLRVSPPRPGFELRAVPSSLNLRAATSLPVTVHALRRDGFEGEIQIALKNAPDGFEIADGLIPAKEAKGVMQLSGPGFAVQHPFTLELEGRAVIAGQQVTRKVLPAEDRMQAFAYRHLVPSQDLRVAVLGGRESKPVDARIVSTLPLRIPAGGTAKILFDVSSDRSVLKSRIVPSRALEGIAVQGISRSAQTMEIALSSDAAKLKPGTKGELLLSASLTVKSKKNPGIKTNLSRQLPAIPFEITNEAAQ